MLLDSGHIQELICEHFFVRIYIQILTTAAEVKIPVTVEQINTVNTIKEQLFPTTNVPVSSNQPGLAGPWLAPLESGAAT